MVAQALLLGFIAFLAMVFAGSNAPGSSSVGMLIVSSSLALAAILVRFRFTWGVALGMGAGLLQVVWPASFNPMADVLLAYVFHAIGQQPNPRWRRFGLGSAILASLACAIVINQALWPFDRYPMSVKISHTVFLLVTSGAVAFGGWMAGNLKWQRQVAVEATVAAEVAQVEQVRLQQESEAANHRERIATDMHDVVAHSLAVIAAQSDGARYALTTQPAQAEQALDVIGDTARSAISDLRRILTELRFQQPDGATASADSLYETFRRLRASGMNLEVTEIGEHPEPGLLTLTLHRVTSEALTNALKYADLSQPVNVELRWEASKEQAPGVRIVSALHDASETAATESAEPTGTGHGLTGMRQRAASVGGDIAITQSEGQWCVELRVPEDLATTTCPRSASA